MCVAITLQNFASNLHVELQYTRHTIVLSDLFMWSYALDKREALPLFGSEWEPDHQLGSLRKPPTAHKPRKLWKARKV